MPLTGVEPFEPFAYGDHLWETSLGYFEFYGLAHLRKPRGSTAMIKAPMRAEEKRSIPRAVGGRPGVESAAMSMSGGPIPS